MTGVRRVAAGRPGEARAWRRDLCVRIRAETGVMLSLERLCGLRRCDGRLR
jgi:hypothetical protein